MKGGRKEKRKRFCAQCCEEFKVSKKQSCSQTAFNLVWERRRDREAIEVSAEEVEVSDSLFQKWRYQKHIWTPIPLGQKGGS